MLIINVLTISLFVGLLLFSLFALLLNIFVDNLSGEGAKRRANDDPSHGE